MVATGGEPGTEATGGKVEDDEAEAAFEGGDEGAGLGFAGEANEALSSGDSR